VPVARVVELARRVAEAQPFEIALADTIGVGAPAQVVEVVERVREAVPGIPLRCHFHNTRNTGIANAYAAVAAGVTTLDASLGGIGGCPFAPAATGNIPTEDLVYMLERSGYRPASISTRRSRRANGCSSSSGGRCRACSSRQGAFRRRPCMLV
jgi:hydroxymethylglutaryl-CoA lyase